MNWTDAQRAAIEARNDTVLVSAAAGSGKTAVLVERVTRMIREGGDITRMLIVTFTRAAAAEMRERITAALEKEGADAHMRKMSLRVSRAQISTLHIFCQSVIREHFEVLDVDPMARVGDEAKLASMYEQAAADALEDACATPSKDQRVLFERYSDADILNMVASLRRFLLSLPDPWDWAARQAAPFEGSLASHPCFQVLRDECLLRLESVEALLDACGKILNKPGAPARYEQTFEQDAQIVRELIDAANAGVLRGGNILFPTLSNAKRKEGEDEQVADDYKAARDRMKKATQSARDLIPADERLALDDLNVSLPAIRALCALTRDAQARYDELKSRKNLLDYNDLEHFCYAALQHGQVQKAVAARYDAIFIDEYQDVSGIQESIINAVHQNNTLFLVGDVKQSIYRFRLADPTLFLKKFSDFSDAPDAEKRRILLSQNFRSVKNVLRCVNHVFSGAMRARVTEIEYDAQAALRPADDAPEGPAAELHIVRAAAQEDGTEGQLSKGYLFEAQLAARRILELKKTMRVTEKGQERPLRFRDVVILLRNARAHAALIAKVLQNAGIPVYSDVDESFFLQPEVTDILNLLRVLDNPYQDLPLLSALRCPAFAFSEEELARIRLTDMAPKTPFYKAFYKQALLDTPLGQKAAAAIATLDRWRFMSRFLPLDTLIRRLLDETGIYMLAGAMRDGESHQANLRLLCERANQDGIATPHDFLESIDARKSTEDDRSAKSLSDNEDVVRIMTMHKSKGLEFPVVILMQLASRFKTSESTPLRMDANLGLAMNVIDSEARVARTTFTTAALECRAARKTKAEEARLLYVAMTRAREKLILLASPARLAPEYAVWQLPAGDVAAAGANSMLDWVGQAVLPGLLSGENNTLIAENGAQWDICWEDADALVQQAPTEPLFVPSLEEGPVPELVERMMSRTDEARAPLKTSVSSIAKRYRAAEDEEETPAEKRNVSRETLEDRPRFLREAGLTAAERGSAVHKALGCVPYQKMRGADEQRIVGALDALREKKLLSATERQAVRASDLARFFAGALGQRALNAQTVHREWPFNLRADEQTIVQGVLDLCFIENGAWILVDYKTDAVSDASELIGRYGDQMRWYARALRELTGLPVREMLLYSIRTGEAAPVPPAAIVRTNQPKDK